MVEPNSTRRDVVVNGKFADEVLETLPAGQQSAISFVASSNLQACIDAIESTEFGGTVMLFSGINISEQLGVSTEYELIHRGERSVVQEDAFGYKRTRLIGSSGYILDDVKRSIVELEKYYQSHYSRVQNVEVPGLLSGTALYREPSRGDVRFPGKAVEALLSTDAVDDPYVAETLKVLIRL